MHCALCRKNWQSSVKLEVEISESLEDSLWEVLEEVAEVEADFFGRLVQVCAQIVREDWQELSQAVCSTCAGGDVVGDVAMVVIEEDGGVEEATEGKDNPGGGHEQVFKSRQRVTRWRGCVKHSRLRAEELWQIDGLGAPNSVGKKTLSCVMSGLRQGSWRLTVLRG